MQRMTYGKQTSSYKSALLPTNTASICGTETRVSKLRTYCSHFEQLIKDFLDDTSKTITMNDTFLK